MHSGIDTENRTGDIEAANLEDKLLAGGGGL
jgi:hypothetical protein